MTAISIAYEVSDASFARVEALLREVALRDVNWCGANLTMERGDFTCIAHNNSADAVALLNRIQHVIEGDA